MHWNAFQIRLNLLSNEVSKEASSIPFWKLVDLLLDETWGPSIFGVAFEFMKYENCPKLRQSHRAVRYLSQSNPQLIFLPHKIFKKNRFMPNLHKKSCMVSTKGQLISKCPFGVIVSTKIPTNFFMDFCPISKKRLNKKNTMHLIFFLKIFCLSL